MTSVFEPMKFQLSEEPEYIPCANCTKHPSYPDILPVTLHEKGVCLICKTHFTEAAKIQKIKPARRNISLRA